MEELLFDVDEIILNSKKIIISILKKNNKYIVEKCILNKNTIELIYQESFNSINQAIYKYSSLKNSKKILSYKERNVLKQFIVGGDLNGLKIYLPK